MWKSVHVTKPTAWQLEQKAPGGERNLLCVRVLVVLTIMQYFSHLILLTRAKLTGSLLGSHYEDNVQKRNE
jgi:hypothetical protein